MPELEIIGGPQSNFVWVTRIACAEKGIPHTNVAVMPHSPEVTAIHPLGKIPVMRHGDVTLAESRAICLYIDRNFDGPSLIPADPRQAAETEQWVSLICTAIDPGSWRPYAGGYFFPQTADGSPDRTLIDPAIPKLEQHLGLLDRAVAGGHLAAGRFTLADAYAIPILYYLRTLPESGAMIARATSLGSYLTRHLERPSVRDTIPPPLPGVTDRVLTQPAVAA
jgi:glutathione S-transferase